MKSLQRLMTEAGEKSLEDKLRLAEEMMERGQPGAAAIVFEMLGMPITAKALEDGHWDRRALTKAFLAYVVA